MNHPKMIRWEGVPAGLLHLTHLPHPGYSSTTNPPPPSNRHPAQQEAASGTLTSLWRLYLRCSAWELARATDININKACCWGPPVRGLSPPSTGERHLRINLQAYLALCASHQKKRKKKWGLVLSQELLLGPCHSCTIIELPLLYSDFSSHPSLPLSQREGIPGV